MGINQFYLAGINYKKTDASGRGQFAINNEQYASLLRKAGLRGFPEIFVLSTCNRTEIYGLVNTPDELTALLCSETAGSIETFNQHAYIKQGYEAVEHLFRVAAGLDSQILGDYEIVGQMKLAVKFARDRGYIGTFLERLTNIVLQSSKKIKNDTALSSGTVSVSFAAIQFLKDNVPDIRHKKILLLGTGKIGRNTCKNIVDYLETDHITLINRTEEKARELAQEMNLRTASYKFVRQEIEDADVVIVATSSEEPVITKESLQHSSPKIMIDLSIPNNIEPGAKELPQITLVNVDDLSKINDATLQKRLAEVPRAKAIIGEYIEEFREWYNMRKYVPLLKEVKQKLTAISGSELFLSIKQAEMAEAVGCSYSDAVQKAISTMAVKMREDNLKPGCTYIETLHDFITGRAN